MHTPLRHRRQGCLNRIRGRAFYQCPFWNEKAVDCGYFQWVDQPHASGDEKVVKELRRIDADLKLNLAELQSVTVSLRRMEEKFSYACFSFGVIVLSIGFFCLGRLV